MEMGLDHRNGPQPKTTYGEAQPIWFLTHTPALDRESQLKHTHSLSRTTLSQPPRPHALYTALFSTPQLG